MTSARWRQIEELYHAALDGDPEARVALLAESDSEVGREVESLLAQKSAAGLLDRPWSML